MSKQTDLINIPDAITVSDSNVGIGTSSPTSPLHITGSGHTAVTITAGTSSDAQIRFGDSGDTDSGMINYDNTVNALKFVTNGADRMRIDTSGNVGIGTATITNPYSQTPFTDVNINGTWGGAISFQLGGVTKGWVGQRSSGNEDMVIGATTGQELLFYENNAEAARISSGNLLVGKTSGPNYNAVGIDLASTGNIQATRSGGEALVLNRQTNDGDIAHFRKDGTLVGVIGTLFGDLHIGTGNTGLRFTDSSNVIMPFNVSTNSERDNAIGLGQASTRFEDAFVTNGVTTGSDANDKQDIATLTATEMLVAARLSQTFRTYRWKDAVVKKGDNARTHTGTIAQEVQAAFTAEGLDAGDYAMFMSDTWWTHDVEVPAVEAVEAVDEVTETTTDEDGNEVVTVITEAVEAVEAVDAYTRTDNYDTEDEAPEGATSKTRLGIRYPELLSFVAAYNEQRFASIEARLTALEA